MTSMDCCCWGNGSWMTSSVKMVANWKNIHLHSRGANSWQGNPQLFAPASLSLCQGINAALRAFRGSYTPIPQSCGVESEKNCHNLKKIYIIITIMGWKSDCVIDALYNYLILLDLREIFRGKIRLKILCLWIIFALPWEWVQLLKER